MVPRSIAAHEGVEKVGRHATDTPVGAATQAQNLRCGHSNESVNDGVNFGVKNRNVGESGSRQSC